MLLSVLIPAAIVAVLGVIIAAGIFVLQRVRAGQPLNLSFRTIAAAYFHLMAIACFLVMTVGIATGLKAGLSEVFDRDFSYFHPPSPARVVIDEGPPGPPGRLRPSSAEEQTERNRRDVERQYQNDLIQGITLTVVGAVLWGLHTIGRRQVTPEDVEPFFSRAHSTVLLAIFGIVGVVALPVSLYELLRFFIITVDADQNFRSQPPGASVATALVFVPVWIYYLADILRRTRRETVPSPSMGEGP